MCIRFLDSLRIAQDGLKLLAKPECLTLLSPSSIFWDYSPWVALFLYVCAHAPKPRVCVCPVHDPLELELQVATALGLKTRLLLKGQKVLSTTKASFQCPALLHSVSPCVERYLSATLAFPFLTNLPKCCIYRHTQPHHHYLVKLRAELAGLVPSQTSVLSPARAFQFTSRS